MKKWSQPKMEKLDVMSTKGGNGPIITPDKSYVDADGDTWYQFPKS